MNALRKSLYHLDGAYYLSSKAKEDNNMPMALNYQFSIFGNYSIVPTPEIVTQLMARINASTGEAFLPNPFRILDLLHRTINIAFPF